jgi:hypothetical protein
MIDKKPDTMKFSQKRKMKQKKETVGTTIKFQKIKTLMSLLESEFVEFERERENIYYEFANDYTESKFNQYVGETYSMLRKPLYQAYWLGHPHAYHKIISNMGDENIIWEALRELTFLYRFVDIGYQIEDNSADVPYSVLNKIREYRKSLAEIAADIRKSTQESIREFENMSKKFVGNLSNLVVRDWNIICDDLKLSNLNNLIFHSLSLLEFQGDLIERYPNIDQTMINNKLSDMEEFAEGKRMKRVLKILHDAL